MSVYEKKNMTSTSKQRLTPNSWSGVVNSHGFN